MFERLESVAEPSDPDVTLWRFMDFTKYVAMLHRRALFFTRADQLPDPFEGMYARRNHRTNKVLHHQAEQALRQRVFLSCWHQNEHESAAMWRIYLRSEEGVAIRSSPRRLRAGLSSCSESLLFGTVRYLDYSQERVPEGHELDPFFCKRKSFEYEREVRLLWREGKATEEPGRYIVGDLEQLVAQVVVSPMSEAWLRELVCSVTEKFGYNLPVVSSTMFDPPSGERAR